MGSVAHLEDVLRRKAADAVDVAANEVVSAARSNASARFRSGSGTIENTTHVESRELGPDRFTTAVVVDARHAEWQDKGTGVYIGNPPITARSGGLLRFYWPKTARVMFLRSVRGTPPTRWWSDAWADGRDALRDAYRS